MYLETNIETFPLLAFGQISAHGPKFLISSHLICDRQTRDLHHAAVRVGMHRCMSEAAARIKMRASLQKRTQTLVSLIDHAPFFLPSLLALPAGISRGDGGGVARVVRVEVVPHVGRVDGKVDTHELHPEDHVPGPLWVFI